MKILHIINNLNIGGAEKLLVDVLPLFDKKDFVLDVLVFEKVNNHLEEKLKLANINIITLNVQQPISFFKLRRLMKLYNLVHVHLFPSQYIVAIANMLLFRDKKILITTEHSTDNRRRRYLLFRYLDRFIYRRYNKIISISEGTTQALSQYLDSKKNIVTIPNGIDIDFYRFSKRGRRSDFGLENEDFLLIMVARFSNQKDQDTLIKSLLELPSNVKLLLVGDGVRRVFCESLVVSLKLQKRVLFLGVRSDVAQLLKMADLSITSSHIEGFGLAAVEAMAAGIPVIASNIPGLADVVDKSGLLFSEGNYLDLASKIKMLYDNKKLYEEYVVKCQARSSEFSLKKMVNSTSTIYKELYFDMLNNPYIDSL